MMKYNKKVIIDRNYFLQLDDAYNNVKSRELLPTREKKIYVHYIMVCQKSKNLRKDRKKLIFR